MVVEVAHSNAAFGLKRAVAYMRVERIMFMRSLIATLLIFITASSIAAPVVPPLALVVLGSGGPGATGRAGAGYMVLLDGEPRILVDAGPGTFARLGEAKLSLARTDIVLLTHLHIDHTGELPGLFKARAVSSAAPQPQLSPKVMVPKARRLTRRPERPRV